MFIVSDTGSVSKIRLLTLHEYYRADVLSFHSTSGNIESIVVHMTRGEVRQAINEAKKINLRRILHRWQ